MKDFVAGSLMVAAMVLFTGDDPVGWLTGLCFIGFVALLFGGAEND